MAEEFEMGMAELPPKQKKKGSKVKLIIISVILVIAVGLGSFYAVAPRDFLQLFLNDKNYTKLAIGKSAAKIQGPVEIFTEYLKTRETKEVEASLNINLSSSIMESVGEDPSFAQFISYMNTLKIKGKTTKNGILSQSEMALYDNNGKLLDVSLLTDSGAMLFDSYMEEIKQGKLSEVEYENSPMPALGTYFKINTIDSGWVALSKRGFKPGAVSSIMNETLKNEDNKEKLDRATKNIMVSLMDSCIGDNVKAIEPNQEIRVESAVVRGDKISFTLIPEQLIKACNEAVKVAKEDEDLYSVIKSAYEKAAKANPDIVSTLGLKGNTLDKDGYKKLVDGFKAKINKSFNEAEWKQLEISIYVDKKNEVTGINILYTPKDGRESKEAISVALPTENGNKDFVIATSDLDEKNKFVFEIIQETETSGKTKLHITDEGGGLVDINGTYKNYAVKDGVTVGETTQKYYISDPDEDGVFLDRGTITIKASLNNGKYAQEIKLDSGEFGEITLNLSSKKVESKNVEIPIESEVLDLSSEKEEDMAKLEAMVTKGMTYLYTDIEASHPELFALIEAIMAEEEGVEDAEGGFMGDSLIGGIFA